MVEENLNKGASLQRMDLLKPRPSYPTNAVPATQIKPKFKPTFIITYNPNNPDLRGWLRETYFILQSDSKMAKIYPRPPSVVFKQARSLKNHLVRSHFKELPHSDQSDHEDHPAGCYKHQHGARGGGSRRKLCKTSSPVHSQDYTTKCGTTLHAKAGTQCTS